VLGWRFILHLRRLLVVVGIISDVSDDAELLIRWREGEQAAGEQLLNRYFDSLYRFFASKVDGVTEDLIQRTLLACVETANKVENPASFRAYLFTVARHELYAHLRQLKGDRERAGADMSVSQVQDPSDSIGTLMIDRQEQRLLLKALRRIPMDLQIVLGLHYWEGLPTTELATVLEIPRGTVKSRLRRGREELEAKMRQLAGSTELLRSTIDNLDMWVASLRSGEEPRPPKK
tara:strand:- start:24511 stop:25209 length:699 start_codon:yes stop_codon:yes gene_type:complete